MIRALLQSITEKAGKVRRFVASGRTREVIRDGGMYQHYGFTSDPPAGTRYIVFGSSGNETSVAEDVPGSRPQLKDIDGASCLWQDADHYILIKNDGSIAIKTDGVVSFDADSVKLGGALSTQKLPTYTFAVAVCAALATLTGGSFPATPEVIVGGLTEKTEAE